MIMGFTYGVLTLICELGGKFGTIDQICLSAVYVYVVQYRQNFFGDTSKGHSEKRVL